MPQQDIRSDNGGFLEALASYYQPNRQTPDMGDSKRRQLRRLGLSMMAGSGPRGSGITGIGQAGLNVMDQNDAARTAEAEAEAQQRESNIGLLETLADMSRKDRDFRAGREDEKFDRGSTEYDQYLKLLELKRKGEMTPLEEARLEYLKARTDKTRSESGKGGLDTGEIMLRTGQRADLDDVRQLYRERYGKWDPIAQQYSFGPEAPTLDDFFSRIVSPETNPFLNKSDPLGVRQ